jgi:hypothetical protein
MREHARVVQELVSRRVAAFRHVSQVLEEKSQRLTVRDSQPFLGVHGRVL